MAVTARNDFDRLINGIATGNVISGVNTLSGNAGKDVLGAIPNKVTQILFNATIQAVPLTGADLAGDYGVLHINPNGSYTYTRSAINIYDLGGPIPAPPTTSPTPSPTRTGTAAPPRSPSRGEG